MKKEIITDRQGAILVILFIMGSSVIIGTGYSAKKDIWLANVTALGLAIMIANVYARILSLFPGKDLFDILKILFGNIMSKILIVIFAWFPFHLGALVLDNFGEFIRTIPLPNTPKVIPMLIYIMLCIWGVKEGIEVLGRWGEFFLPIIIITIILIIPLMDPMIDFQNIIPVLEKGIYPVWRGTVEVFSFPFGETVAFLMVFSCLQNRNSPYKAYRYGLLFGGILILVISTLNVIVLGAADAPRNYFPSYNAVSRIHVGDFVQRLEEFVSVVFLLTGFIKISICLLAASNGISKLFNMQDYRFIVTPIGLLTLNLAYFVYPNTMEMVDWATRVVPYFFFPFQVIFPVIIFIAAEIKIRKKKIAH